MSPSATSISVFRLLVCFDPFPCFQEGTLRGSPFSKAQLSKLAAIFNKANSPPRLAARMGGRAIMKICAQHALSQGRRGAPIDGTRNTTLAASNQEASRHFLGDAASPPRGDARRGIRSF